MKRQSSHVLIGAWLLSVVPVAAQLRVVDAIPDTTLLQQPFCQTDEVRFLHPDKSFYPETWFHFLNGSINKAGITADLEAIAGAGITGIQFFHGKQGDGKDFPGTKEHIECLSPQWESLLTHTASEAKRLGLRFSIQTCPGWAMSGGPWVTPDKAMRNLTCNRVDVEGGKEVNVTLPLRETADWQDYRDIVTLAFPTPHDDIGTYLRAEQVLAKENTDKWKACVNGNPNQCVRLQPTTVPHVVEVVLPREETVRSLEFNPIDRFNHSFGVDPAIHVKMTALTAQGEQTVLDADMPAANWQDTKYGMTFALKESRAQRYRVEITNTHDMDLWYMHLSSAVRKNNWEGEAGWTLRSVMRENEHTEYPSECYVDYGDIVDISTFVTNGQLHWKAPKGKWTILRIGHVNAGEKNGPAPDEATGWEINKLDADCVKFQFDSYIGRLHDTALKGLVDNMLMDSWECRSQTWTTQMPQEFESQRGYDVTKWIPALFGYVIGNQEQTAAFLCDWRQTQNALFVHNFYGTMTRLAHEKGMTASYETAAGDIFPGDPMEYYKFADVPMTEFWQPFSHFLANRNYKPIRPTASAARMYGKPRVSAEAFTSFDMTWDEHLGMLRDVANQNMVEGVTHLVFHTYTHNPDPDKYFPGTSFGANIGTPFLRKQTWWQYMPAFTTYLARCAYMLERGKPVSAVLTYLGDEIQQKPDQLKPFVKGYAFDYCNTDALLHRIDVKDGKWMTPDGIEYEVLWLADAERMLPETLERLYELVAKGGVLVGNAPSAPATLGDNLHQQSRFNTVVEKLWKNQNLKNRVLSGISLEEALGQLSVATDVMADGLKWTHRHAGNADWYFVCPKQEESFDGIVEFGCEGTPELWNPINGTVEPLAAQWVGGKSRIRMNLSCGESMFVVFRHDKEYRQPAKQVETTVPWTPQWTLTFPQSWTMEQTLTLDNLTPWNELNLSEEGRAFSGTAQYATVLDMDEVDESDRYLIDLGKVEEIAVVQVNGQVVDTLWTSPYRTEVGKYLREGKNIVNIEVTNTWFNRLAYDANLPENERRTWVIHGPKPGTPLRQSGLLGPVKLVRRQTAPRR